MEGNTHFDNPDLFSDSSISSREQKLFENKDFSTGVEEINLTFGTVPTGRVETLERSQQKENVSAPDENDMIQKEDRKPFENEDFVCNICQKRCVDITDLTEHISATHSYKVFPCNFCPDIFFKKKKLKEHKKCVHPNERKQRKKDSTKEKNVKKDTIPSKLEVASENSQAKNNVSLAFGGKPNYYEADLDKDFRCERCYRGFDRKLNLVIHMKKYHGETIPSQKAIAKQKSQESGAKEGGVQQESLQTHEKNVFRLVTRILFGFAT